MSEMLTRSKARLAEQQLKAMPEKWSPLDVVTGTSPSAEPQQNLSRDFMSQVDVDSHSAAINASSRSAPTGDVAIENALLHPIFTATSVLVPTPVGPLQSSVSVPGTKDLSSILGRSFADNASVRSRNLLDWDFTLTTKSAAGAFSQDSVGKSNQREEQTDVKQPFPRPSSLSTISSSDPFFVAYKDRVGNYKDETARKSSSACTGSQHLAKTEARSLANDEIQQIERETESENLRLLLQDIEIKKEKEVEEILRRSKEKQREQEVELELMKKKLRQLEDEKLKREEEFLRQKVETRRMDRERDEKLESQRQESLKLPTETFLMTLNKTLRMSRIPPPIPLIFTGKPMEYVSWRRSITHLIDQDVTEAEKLTYLQQYMSETVRQSVKAYFQDVNVASSNKILEELDKRFGDQYALAQSYLDELNDWPNVKERDPAALQSFSDMLFQTAVVAQHSKYLKSLDEPRQVKTLSDRLPESHSKAWKVMVNKYKDENDNNYPPFAVFARFVKKRSDIENDPVYSAPRTAPGGSKTSSMNHSSRGTSVSKTSLATSHQCDSSAFELRAAVEELGKTVKTLVTRADLPQARPAATGSSADGNFRHCNNCKSNDHWINQCDLFKKMEMKEKIKKAISLGLCFRCLGRSHTAAKCTRTIICSCKGKHHPLLHTPDFDMKVKQILAETREERMARRQEQLNGRDFKTDFQKDEVAETNTLQAEKYSLTANVGVVYKNLQGKHKPQQSLTTMIVPVYLSTVDQPEKEHLCYAMLDSQSDATYVVEETADKTKAPSRPAILSITTVTHKSYRVKSKAFRNLQIRGRNSAERILLNETFSRDSIDVNPERIPTCDTAKGLPHLEHLASEMPKLLNIPVSLLIGYDNAEALRPLKTEDGPKYQPYAVLTHFGWTIIGAQPQQECFDKIGNSHCIMISESSKNELENVCVFKTEVKEVHLQELVQMMNRDFQDSGDGLLSQEDQRFIDMLKDNIQMNKEGHFQMPLPLSKDKVLLPDNRHLAMRRLLSLKGQFKKRGKYHEHYISFMKEILQRGDAERVPAEEINKEGRWYLPHHGVYHPKKPGKLRVVFDCSARHQGESLNDYLLQGPDMLNSLMGVLCRFRLHEVAFSCDIEKMFHQFHVNTEDRDFLRFLWWEDGDVTGEPIDYRMKVHLFGATSSPGCANFGLKHIANVYRHLNDNASDFLKKDFYVDDGLKSEPTTEQAVETLTKAREICKKGKLRLHKISSNSKELLESFPDTELAKEKRTSLVNQNSEDLLERTLGIQWNTNEDTFSFRAENRDVPMTRRGLLSAVASLYDPLGFISPLILVGRQILQETCHENLGWDDPIGERLSHAWDNWLKELGNLCTLKIPRCYKPQDFGPYSHLEIHHFSDASDIGYGTCSYLRAMNKEGKIHNTLIMSKSRVAPKKKVTIPRLELQAAVLSTKNARFLEKELDTPIEEHYFWTDSKVVLGYVLNESKRFHVYVANRVQQIRDVSKPCQWHHVNTRENPADYTSRGITVEQMVTQNWFGGPEFLCESRLPADTTIYEVDDADAEVKQSYHAQIDSGKGKPFPTFEELLSRFSSLDKAKAVFGHIIRVFRKKRGKDTTEFEARQAAMRAIIRQVQKEHFEKPSPSQRNSLEQLDARLDEDGLLIVGGRIQNSHHSRKVMNPLLIPKESHLAVLISRKAHQKCRHQGRTTTIHEIRSSGFWILGMRRVVDREIKTCRQCTRQRGAKLSQKMGDLPEERTHESPPFTHCGIDCFGPFVVKEGRSSKKCYALMVTCLASRAVHIELLDDMSTDAFINAIRSVIALRGNIRTLFCDRGTNFIGASREFREAMKEMCNEECRRRLLEYECEFKFNPPSASHMGGVWERQIRSVRSALFGIFGDHKRPLKHSELQTLFHEAAAVVNNRPLCVESLETPDSMPLSPNHILTMKTEPIFPPPGKFEPADVFTKRRWRAVQYLAEEFWSRWIKEYLSTQQSRKVWRQAKRSLKVGDLVWLSDDFTHRASWPMARVIETFPGKDGLVRRVRLRVSNSDISEEGIPKGTPQILERPIHKLVMFLPTEEQ